MPIVVRHDSQYGRAADLAASQGQYRSGQDAFNRGLQLDQNDRANSALGFGQQEAQQDDVANALRTILSDVTARQRDQNRFDQQGNLLDQRLQGNLDNTALRDSGAMDRAQLRSDTQTNVADANRQSRDSNAEAANKLKQTIFEGGDQTKRYLGELKNGYDYDHLKAMYDLAEEKTKAMKEREQAQTFEQQKRAQDRLERSAQLSQIHAMISEQVRQRNAAYKMLLSNSRMAFKPLTDADVSQALSPFDQKIDALLKAMRGGGGQQMPAPQVQDLSGMLPTGAPMGMEDAGQDYQAPQPMGLQGPPTPAGPQQPVVIQSEQEYVQLPPGTLYVAPDGTVRQKQ